jgi:hypothetical protein
MLILSACCCLIPLYTLCSLSLSLSLSRPFALCLVLPCLVLSYLACPCPALPCPALPCLRSVYKLFRSRGLSAVINDGLVDTAMRFAQAGVGMLCLVASHWYSYLTGLDYASRTLLSLVALAEGYFLSAITLKVFSAAVTTIYVCYAEDPQAFQVIYIYIIYYI